MRTSYFVSSPPSLKPPTPMDGHSEPPEMDCMADACSVKPTEDSESNENLNKHPNTPPPLSPLPTAAPSSSLASAVIVPKKTNKRLAKELTPCRMLLDELEEQEESWPFLLPVNTKQFPTYRKIIRWPMDLSTIKKKLSDGQLVFSELHLLERHYLHLKRLFKNDIDKTIFSSIFESIYSRRKGYHHNIKIIV